MAERTVTIKECDRLRCRTRKGTKNVVVTIKWGVGDESIYAGDLCPFHQRQLQDKIDMMFHNEKDSRPGEGQ